MSEQAQAEIPIGDPMRDAWEAYKLTEDYRNTLRWAANPGHPDVLIGSLWAAFVKGWTASSERNTPLPDDSDKAWEARVAGYVSREEDRSNG